MLLVDLGDEILLPWGVKDVDLRREILLN
jgi:hypothetical protein